MTTFYPRGDTPAFLGWELPTGSVDLWEWQAGRCAMCGGLARAQLVMDHCHMTGLKRGYICSHCNSVESRSMAVAWERWREGLNSARLMGEDETYISPWTNRPVVDRTLTADEQEDMFRRVRAALDRAP